MYFPCQDLLLLAQVKLAAVLAWGLVAQTQDFEMSDDAFTARLPEDLHVGLADFVMRNAHHDGRGHGHSYLPVAGIRLRPAVVRRAVCRRTHHIDVRSDSPIGGLNPDARR